MEHQRKLCGLLGWASIFGMLGDENEKIFNKDLLKRGNKIL
jgi:hypothetical protein